MKYTIYLHPGSSKNEVEKLDNNSLRVRVTAQPIDGEANDALVELLSEHFGVPKSTIEIIQGLKSKTKIVEVESEEEKN